MGNKVMFAGASGTGKTTLAKRVSDMLSIPFVSGSYSDLVPETKSLKHVDMITEGWVIMKEKDERLLSLRSQLFSSQFEFVSDRSYIDNIAYYILKLSQHVSNEEVSVFMEKALSFLEKDCNKLIFIPFSHQMINIWQVEDNNKRITNGFFQHMVSLIMEDIIRNSFLLKPSCQYYDPFGNTVIHTTGELDILILNKIPLEDRMRSIERFLISRKIPMK